MDAEGEVQCRTSCRHGLDFSLGGEYENLGSEEVELDGVEEVHGVWLWVVKNLLDGTQPFVQLGLILGIFDVFSLLIFPVGGKPLLGYFVHAVRAYLYLYPPSLLRHQGDVQGLIAVGFWVVEPVAQPVWVALVDFGDGDIDVEALVDLLLALVGGEDDADGQDVVNFLKSHMLVLHLAPDGVGCLHALLDGIFDAHLLEGILDGRCELVEQLTTLGLGGGELLLDDVVFVGMLVLEAEILQLRLDLVQSEAVGQRCIDIQCLAGDLVLLVGWL